MIHDIDPVRILDRACRADDIGLRVGGTPPRAVLTWCGDTLAIGRVDAIVAYVWTLQNWPGAPPTSTTTAIEPPTPTQQKDTAP